jgi:DNA polymerase
VLVLVGEQPGDHEDIVGKPFVGPAGRVLDRALKAAGIGREKFFLANAVKHFTHEQRSIRDETEKEQEFQNFNAARPRGGAG